MKNLKDTRTKIVPSKTRVGKELLSSSALDSPSVLSKLATPPPAINSDMSQVIDDTTSAMNDTYEDASTMLDNTVPLGEFFDEQLAKAKEIENAKNVETLENYDSPIMPSSPTRVESPDEHVFDREMARAILACNDRDEVIKLLAEMKEKSMKERMKYDPKFLPPPYLLLIRIMNFLSILS
jgi:hypothetical protein